MTCNRWESAAKWKFAFLGFDSFLGEFAMSEGQGGGEFYTPASVAQVIGRSTEGEPKVTHKRNFLHRPNGDGAYTLRATEDTPFFHHVATLAELQLAAEPASGKLYTFHFNALRSIMEKTASFFGHADIKFCIKALDNEEDRALYSRALNLLSHGKYAIHEPTEMGEDNKELFRRILRDFTTTFQFALPDIVKV